MASVRIILDEVDGELGDTWIVVSPIPGNSYPYGNTAAIWKAIDEAAELFKMSVARDSEVIRERLKEAE